MNNYRFSKGAFNCKEVICKDQDLSFSIIKRLISDFKNSNVYRFTSLTVPCNKSDTLVLLSKQIIITCTYLVDV